MPFSSIAVSVLAVQALRYLIFDHGTFEFIWKHFHKMPVIGKFLSCPFCQGFWIGLIIFTPQIDIILALGWSFASGWLAYLIAAKMSSADVSNKRAIAHKIEEPAQCGDFSDEVAMLECNIDDMSGEFFGDVMDRLFAAGAIDVWFTSAYGKKNRPLYQLSVLISLEKEENAIREIFTHSSTAGIRRRIVRRTVMDRSFIKVKVDGELIAVKKLSWKDVIKYTPEWDDCSRASKKTDKPVSEIYSKAQAEAISLDSK